MAFVDVELPRHLAVGAQREDAEPGLEIIVTDGGREDRNNRHAQSTLTWTIDLKPYRRDSETLEDVKALFKATRGGLHTFPFSDCDPAHSVLDDENIGTGNAATTIFQITKTWTVGGQSQTRRITRPESPIVVKVNNIVQSSGVTVNYTTGIVTFDAAPGNGLAVTVSGKFRFPVRFEAAMVATGLASHLERIETLSIVEVKE